MANTLPVVYTITRAICSRADFLNQSGSQGWMGTSSFNSVGKRNSWSADIVAFSTNTVNYNEVSGQAEVPPYRFPTGAHQTLSSLTPESLP